MKLVVSIYQAKEVFRGLRKEFKLQRIKRGKYLISDANGMFGEIRLTTDEMPDKQVDMFVDDDTWEMLNNA